MFKRDSYCTSRYNSICLLCAVHFQSVAKDRLFILHSCKDVRKCTAVVVLWQNMGAIAFQTAWSGD